jgi:hypothetical protein
MSRKEWYVAIGAGVALWLLLRKKAAAAAASEPLTGGFTPLGIASIYFDTGETFDINANTNSPDFGRTLSAN